LFLLLFLRKSGRGEREHECERGCRTWAVCLCSRLLLLSWFCLFVTNS
jgi:hypothetical protein